MEEAAAAAVTPETPLPTPPIRPGILHVRPPGRLLFVYGICTHLVWAFLLAGWGSVIRATPVAGLLKVFNGSDSLLIVLALSSILAIVGVLSRSTLTKVMCLAPQQTLMSMTLVSAMTAVLAETYADGTLRPWAFILADQLPVILGSVFHTIALILLSRRV